MNRLDVRHVYSMSVFSTFALVMWGLLRGHKNRFYPIAWAYAAGCFLEYVSAAAFVSEDELRILWFYINIPGVYILLGQRAGLAMTALTVGNATARHLLPPH